MARSGAGFPAAFGVVLNPDVTTGVVVGAASFAVVFGVCKSDGFASFAADWAGLAKFNGSDLVCAVTKGVPNEGALVDTPNEKPDDGVDVETFVGSVFVPNEKPLVVDDAVSNGAALLKLLLLKFEFKLSTGSVDFGVDFSAVNRDGVFSPPPKIGFVSIGFVSEVAVICGDPKLGVDKLPNNDDPNDDVGVAVVVVGFTAVGVCLSTTSFGFVTNDTFAC